MPGDLYLSENLSSDPSNPDPGLLKRVNDEVKAADIGGRMRQLGGDATVNARDYIATTADGGEAIQAALNDLPSRGGTVYIPETGPDSAESGKGVVEDGVWEVNSQIVWDKKTPLQILGTPGEQEASNPGGTALVAASSISSILKIDEQGGGRINLYGLRMEGGGNTKYANNALTIDKSGAFYAKNCQFSDVANNCIEFTGTGARANFLNCAIRDALTGNGVLLTNFGGNISFSDCYFSRNLIHIKQNHSGVFHLLVDKTEFNGDVNDYVLDVQEDMTNGGILDSIILDPDDAAIRVSSGATLSDFNAVGCYLDAFANPSIPYFLENNGTVEDCNFSDIKGRDVIGTSMFTNVINDPSNAPRTTVNGLSYNGSNDPSSGGVWNGQGREGIRVLWDNSGTPTLSEYVNGTWYSRAL